MRIVYVRVSVGFIDGEKVQFMRIKDADCL